MLTFFQSVVCLRSSFTSPYSQFLVNFYGKILGTISS